MASAPLVRAGDGGRTRTSWKLRNVRLVPFDVNDLPRRLGGAARSAVLAACLAAAALPCSGMTGAEAVAAPADEAMAQPVSTTALGRLPVQDASSLFAGAGATDSALGAAGAPAGT